MRKHIAILALLLCGWIAAWAEDGSSPRTGSEEGREGRFNAATFSPCKPLATSCGQGVSGAFAGVASGKVVVAGGCNFPDVPAADGGQKEFYSEVRVLDGEGWQTVGRLEGGVAYGVSVTMPEGLLCLGGTSDGRTSLRRAVLLSLNDEGGLTARDIVPLPRGLDNFTGAIGDGYVYVAGGIHDGQPSRKAYRLRWPGGEAWQELPDLPGAARVQPVSAVQKDALGSCFYLLGGYDPATGRTVAEGLCYDPRRGEWRQTSAAPTAIVGAAAMPSGTAHILCIGGVDKETFEQALARNARLAELANELTARENEGAYRANEPTAREDEGAYRANELTAREIEDSIMALQAEARDYLRHDADWYRFRRRMMVYHTVTDTWTEMFQSPLMARAGSSLVTLTSGNGQLSALLIAGEEKPGIRSSEVTRIDIAYEAHFGVLNWAVLILYLCGMVYLGYYFMRRAGKSGDDFFKGGGRIPWWAAGISIFATMLSAITYMSIPAKAYATDWCYYPMQVCILIVAFPVIRYYLPFFRRLNVTTAYEYLERRFDSSLRLTASILFIVFMIARTALVLYLPSLAMTAVTGIDIYWCIALMAVITILYCTMGGVEAVVWGDVIQGVILVGGAVMAAIYLIIHTGASGAPDFWHIALADGKFRLFQWDAAHPFDYVNATWWVVILGGLANNLISYTSDQTVIQRYLTTRDEKGAARGILTNGLMSVVVTVAFFTIGTGLYTFFKTHPGELDITMARGDAVFPFFMMSQLPAGLAGLLIAAVFAATMSTIASNINSISTAFTVDLYGKMSGAAARGDKGEEGADGAAARGNKGAEGADGVAARTVHVARVAGIVAGGVGMVIAWLMATEDIHSLLDYFNTILGLLSGAIGGLFLTGIFCPRIGARAAMCGFVSGTAVVMYLNFFTRANFLLFGFVSMLVCVVVGLAASLIWPQDKDVKGLTWQSLDKGGAK